MDSFSEANKRLNSYLKQLISEGNLWKPASNLYMWSHQSTRNCASKVLTRVILEFYTKQPGSYPSILVNWSEKPNINSLKSWRSQWFVSLKQQPRSHKNTNILLEPPGMCSLSIEHVIARLRVSVHWCVAIWSKQTKLKFFGQFLFFSDNHLSNYTKTIIRLRLSKYWWIFPETKSRGIFTNIYWAWGE